MAEVAESPVCLARSPANIGYNGAGIQCWGVTQLFPAPEKYQQLRCIVSGTN